MNYYYCADGSNVTGPCTLEKLTNLRADGALPDTTQVCAEGTQTWQPITALLPNPSGRTVPPPPPFASPPPIPQQGDATGGIIPYKNPQALIAYYLGLFSLLPVIGLLLAIPAFFLGLTGLKNRKRNPAVKGAVHAWIGIIMGGLCTLLWGTVVIFICFAMIAKKAN